MISTLGHFASLVAVADSFKPALGLVDSLSVMEALDWGITIAGCLALIGIVGWSRFEPAKLLGVSELPEPGRMRPEMIIGPILVYLVAGLAARMVLGKVLGLDAMAMSELQGDESSPHLPSFFLPVVNAVAFVFGACACYVVGRTFVARPGCGFVLGTGSHGRAGAEALLAALIALAACPLVLALTQWLIELALPGYVFREHDVIEALRSADAPDWQTAILWIGVVGVTPVAEEMFFRGLLQTALAGVLRSQWFAVVFSGILFGLAHSSQPQVVPAIALFGMILGIIYVRSGSLVGPILAHAVFNGRTLLWEFLSG